jgi:hypothetical protein
MSWEEIQARAAEYRVELIWLGIISALMFFGTLLAAPWLVARIPADYFVRDPSESRFARRHPVIRWTLRILRNLLGVIFILAGIAMLFLPGQGILTILLGLLMVDFPGKRRLEIRLVRRPGVFRSLNWIRLRSGHTPLILPDDPKLSEAASPPAEE